MKKILNQINSFKTLIAILLTISFSFQNSFGASGIFDAYAIYSLNGGANTYTQAPAFNNMIFDNPTSLMLNGGQNKTFKNGSSNVTGGGLQYRIYNSTGTPPSFTYGGAFSFKTDDGGGNQTWEKADANINILSGLTPGIYTIELYFEAYTSDGNQYYNNGGANYKATVIVYNKSNATGSWNSAGSWTSGIPTGNQPILIQSAHTITLNVDASASILKINSGGTFIASDNTVRKLTITKSTSGNVTTLSNGGTWANGSGASTVEFTGAPSGGDAIHAITGTIAFQNITVNKTSGSSNVGVSFGANSSVSGTLEIGSGGFVSTAPPASFYGSTAILKFNQGGVAPTYNVNIGDYTWSTTQVPNFITISSGTVSLNDVRTATGNLLIDGGTLALTAPLTIQGNWTRSSGTFTPNTQVVTLSGSTNTIIDATGGATLYDLVVNKAGSGYVSLSSNLIVSHNLTVSGGILTIPSGKNLTVAGALSNTVGITGLVVKSGGSLIHNSDGIAATVERGITSDASYHLISVPFTGTLPAICDGNYAPLTSSFDQTVGYTYDFFKWNESLATTGNVWTNLKDAAWAPNTADFGNPPTFEAGIGYLVRYFSGFVGSDTKSVSGTLANGSQTIALTASNNKFNLIGNPFPSAIDWKASSGWVRTSLGTDDVSGKSFWIWNNASSNYGAYSSANVADAGINGVTRYIAPSQGFFVEAASAGNLTLDNNVRVPNVPAFLKSSNIADNAIRLKVAESISSYSDEILLEFGHENSLGGVAKWWSMYSEAPSLYTVKADNNFSISFLTDLAENPEIAVNFKPGIDGNYTITSTSDMSAFDQITLLDLKLDKAQDLKLNPSYSFEAYKTDASTRFKLIFGTTGISPNTTSSSIKVYSTPGKINISGADGKAEILVRNMMGQVVLHNSVNGSTLTTVSTNNLPVGVYVVSVVSGKQTVSEKVVIK